MPRTATSDVTAKMLGKQLRAARIKAGLKQTEVAARLGVSPPYVANVEAGRANLTVGQLTHIADAIGAELEITLRVVEEEAVVAAPRVAA